jgi:hypothetical protein
VPSAFARRPERLAGWAIAGGIDGLTRRQAAVGGGGRGGT